VKLAAGKLRVLNGTPGKLRGDNYKQPVFKFFIRSGMFCIRKNVIYTRVSDI